MVMHSSLALELILQRLDGAVANWPVSTTTKEVQKFLGLAY